MRCTSRHVASVALTMDLDMSGDAFGTEDDNEGISGPLVLEDDTDV